MKTALNPVTLSPELSLAEFVNIAGQAGFAGVEFSMDTAAEYAGQHGVEGLRGLFAEAGVGPAQWRLMLPLWTPGSDVSEEMARAPERCALAAEIGAATAMQVVPCRAAVPQDEAMAWLTSILRDAAQLVAGWDVSLALEFIGLHVAGDDSEKFIVTLGDTLDLIERIGEPNVGVMLDFYHFYVGGSTREQLEAMPGELLHMIHIDDAPPGPVEQLKDPMRVLPGEGVIGVADLLAVCAEKGYDGYVSLELFGQELREMAPEKGANRGYKALERVMSEAIR